MTFKEILNLDLIRLPVNQNSEDSFEEQLIDLLHDVEGYVLESDCLTSMKGFDVEVFKKRYETLSDGIIKALRAYYSGAPVKAYQDLVKAIKDSNLMGYLPPTKEFATTSDFYRTRVVEGNYTVSKGELFHIPFQKRMFIKTQRYSITGFPTLYLSSSLYVAWEEMRRPNLDQLKVVRLVNTQPVRCVDLTTDRYLKSFKYEPQEGIAGSEEKEELYAMMAWPLKAACSFKVLDDNAPFKPEYIIPQLMLQFVQQNPDIDGIVFSSTHIDLNNENINGDMYNIAIPVKKDSIQGYCPLLTKLFNSTEVLTAQSMEISSAGGQMWSPDKRVEAMTQQIELVKGVGTQYPYTKFGRMESYLLNMPVGSID